MSLSDRLANRKRPTATYALRIDDDTIARTELAAALAAGDEPRAGVARSAVEACYEQVTITAVSPKVMEELRADHPPTEQQRDRDKATFNPVTLLPVLLAACVESDVTEAEWAEYTTTGTMTAGEVNGLLQAVWDINYRLPNPDVPKG